MATVDVFVGNDTYIDPEVYQYWLNGLSATDAASAQQKKGILQHYGVTFDMLVSDINDHYRCFGMLERYLRNSQRLSEQLEFQISVPTQKLLIEKYYEFDSIIVRELLGKKLTSRDRNSLEDVCEKTRISLRSCRRQFDNIKRVFKAVDDMPGCLVDNIQHQFLLGDRLAQQYAAIVFFTNNRFDLCKKRLSYLTFEDLTHCANLMIKHWSNNARDRDENSMDLDREFLQGLKYFKGLADKENVEEHRQLILSSVTEQTSQAALNDIDNNFKNLTKFIVGSAHRLNHNKELRDFFLDITEQFIDPCKNSGWTADDVITFIKAYQDTCPQLNFFTSRFDSQQTLVWQRYMLVIGGCIVQMYHS